MQRGGTLLMLRRLAILWVLGGLLWLCGAQCAFGATYYLDPAGSDSNNGSSGAPWRTYGKFLKSMNAGTITAGDTVKWRPGRYAACEGLDWPFESLAGPGGAAGNPLTITVDTATAGDVEIHGGARSGICGVPAWTQAQKCTSGYVNALCDTNTECGPGGVCANVSGVWWTRSATDNNNTWYGGIAAGVAYQPALAPGGTPKIYEILYAPNTARVTMPTFTAGRAQVFPYATLPPAFSYEGAIACTGDRTPWLCCTGAAAGTCANSRIYVQTESGVRPDLAGDASFGPVEFPYQPTVVWNGTTSGTPWRHTYWGNSNNGRLFHFRWGLTSIFMFKNADTLTFEDFRIGYRGARANAFIQLAATGAANASRFPWFDGGDSYMIYGWPSSGSNVVRNITFRRGKVHGSQGNEQIHFIGGPVDTHTNLLFEDLEIGDGPYAIPPGASGTALTPNANTNQVTKSWPPPGYESLASYYDTGWWGPLGGGANTDGAFISSSNAQTVRNCYIHDTMLISFFESGGGGDLVFENNLIDLARHYYGGGGGTGHPPMLITAGASGPLALTVGTRFYWPGRRGPIVRNNLFLNVYGEAIRTGMFFNDEGEYPPYKPITPPIVVNNTFQVKGDKRYASAAGNGPVVWFWQTLQGVCVGGSNAGARCILGGSPVCIGGSCQPAGWSHDAEDGTKFVFKNNIFYKDTPSVYAQPLVAIDRGLVDDVAADVNFDYTNYGGNLGTWRLTPTTYSDFGTWRTAIRTATGDSSLEANSMYANPLFVSYPGDLRLQAGSPSNGTALNLSGGVPPSYYGGFDFDITGSPRPSAWSMGAYDDNAGNPTTTTNTTLGTTTTIVTTSTTTTTMSTTSTTLVPTTTSPGTTSTTTTSLPPPALRGVSLTGAGTA